MPENQKMESHQPKICLNCACPILEKQLFCPNCGQNTQLGRITLSSVIQEFFQIFTDADKGILPLVGKLFLKPGHTAREYVEGKRKSLFSPFSYVTLLVGISSILLTKINFISAYQGAQVSGVGRLVEEYANLIILMNMPILAFFNKLLFPKKYSFAENLVLAGYTSGTRSLFFSFVVIPFNQLFPQFHNPILVGYLFCWMTYFGWAHLQFIQSQNIGEKLKGFLIPLLTQLFTTICIGVWMFFALGGIKNWR